MSALNKRVGVAAAGLSCLVIGYAWAQQEQREEVDRPEARQIDRPDAQQAQEYRAEFRAGQQPAAQNQELTRYLANRLIAINEAEIETYQLAQQQAQSQEVRRFAQEAVQDHQQLVQQLQQLAGPQAAPRQPAQPLGAPGQDAQRQPAATPGTDQTLQQLTQIDRQIIERANDALREELQQKEGTAFDQAFLGAQVASHMQMQAALEVLAQQGPDQLQQVAQQARSDVQEHLQQAKQLKQQLDRERQPRAQAERQPGQPARTR